MRVTVICASTLAHHGVAIVRDALREAKFYRAWKYRALASIDGDPLACAVQAFANEHALNFTLLADVVHELWKWTTAVLVITDGENYTCAEYARRSVRQLGEANVYVHTVPWEQGELWG